MRKYVIAGNWKMYKTNQEARQLSEAIKSKNAAIQKTQIVICPPASALSTVSSVLEGSTIGLGAQNMHWENEGAYTGELSAAMIRSAGAAYVIIGHSERRQYFAETDQTVNQKLTQALQSNLNPIVCIGETLAQREQGITMDVIAGQLQGGLNAVSAEQMKKVILAYEPVWAIGTGKTATPEQAQEVHQFIRSRLAAMFDAASAEAVVIQYGGSVKPNNAADLLRQKDIDGALVGGACLEADSFTEIIKAAEALA